MCAFLPLDTIATDTICRKSRRKPRRGGAATPGEQQPLRDANGLADALAGGRHLVVQLGAGEILVIVPQTNERWEKGVI